MHLTILLGLVVFQKNKTPNYDVSKVRIVKTTVAGYVTLNDREARTEPTIPCRLLARGLGIPGLLCGQDVGFDVAMHWKNKVWARQRLDSKSIETLN